MTATEVENCTYTFGVRQALVGLTCQHYHTEPGPLSIYAIQASGLLNVLVMDPCRPMFLLQYPHSPLSGALDSVCWKTNTSPWICISSSISLCYSRNIIHGILTIKKSNQMQFIQVEEYGMVEFCSTEKHNQRS